MRKITAAQIAVFVALFSVAAAAAVVTTAGVLGWLPLGDFRGVVLSLAGFFLFFVYAIAVYRLFLKFFPLSPGEITPNSRQEFIYHVYILFFIMVFYPLMFSGLLPLPLARVLYLALGAKLGANTYGQGIIYDPPFVEIGANSVFGGSSFLVPHVIEGERLAHYPIKIGDHVTIGGTAVVLSDVIIGDWAVVATGAVVTKGTRIGTGEIWGGMPARRLGVREGCGVEGNGGEVTS